ncbi:MAG: N-acetylmuramoyl-L-alanine amidase [Saprospiraceae bacterium]|nr:N-acetylmuramoyl-L-alanine amidase [Saprospiraceae bacterium]
MGRFVAMYFCFSLITPIFGKEPPNQNVIVTAKKGQGVYSLLRTYQLLDNTSNLVRFYELNKLKNGAELEKGKQYKLPLKIIKFDGNNIRSTLNTKNYEKAKDIQIYNEAMVTAGLKSKSYTKDNQLWLPEHFDFNTKTISKKKTNSTELKAVNTAPAHHLERELIADSRLSIAEVRELQQLYAERSSEDSNRSSDGYFKKVSNRMLNVKLFGTKNAEVPVESEELKDQVYYIVPGHGGPDPGAMFKDKESDFTFCEDEYAYDVSLRLARNLMTKGATVYVIVQDNNDGIRDERYLDCDTDEVCIGNHDMPVNQLKRLRQGMIKTNQLYFKHQLEGIKNQWMISIHIDSQPEDNRQDVFFYYQSESKKSKKKAKQLKTVFSNKYKKYQERDYKGTISARPLYVMRTSEADPIFIELANIQNKHDRERIASPRNRQLLADWILEGFLE